MTARFSVAIRRVREDGSEVPADGELAAALAGPAEQFAGLLAWAADEAGYLDHGEREEVIGAEGRELQRRLLQATFDLGAAREERVAQVTSAAGIRHGTVEAGHGRGLASVFGPVRVTRMAYRNRREPNLYPADARQVLPDDPYSLGMRALAAYHLATSGYGQAQEIIEARTGVTAGRAQLAGLAGDLAAWTGDFYEERARDAEEEEQPDSDVIMMQGDGKGIALRPEHRKGGGTDPAHPGIKKMAEIVAVADFTPAVRRAGGHRRPARPPEGAPRPRRAGQVGLGLHHRPLPLLPDVVEQLDPHRTRHLPFCWLRKVAAIKTTLSAATQRLKALQALLSLHIAAHLGMPGSTPQRERSTQKPDQCRRARTGSSGCPQPAGQSSSAAYRTADIACRSQWTMATDCHTGLAVWLPVPLRA